jgi:hypothetical protein
MGDTVGLDTGEDDAEGEPEGTEEEGFLRVDKGGEEVGAVVDDAQSCTGAEEKEEEVVEEEDC